MRRSAVLAVVLLSVALLQAQDRPTFRGGANYVRVDLYATIDGVPVTDLGPEDIEIFEDDDPQTVEDFEYVRVRPAGDQATRREPRTVEESRQMAADPRARVFVLFLDTYHTRIESLGQLRESLGAFVDRLIGPDDLVALMTPEMAASQIALGRKTAILSSFLDEAWWGRRGRRFSLDPQEVRWQACYGFADDSPEFREMVARRREKIVLDALEDLMVHLDGLRDERKAVIPVTEGWPLFERGTMQAPRGQFARPDAQCEQDRQSLMLMDHTFRLREITEQANRGNVTFYPIGAQGLAVFDSDIDELPAPIGPSGAGPPTIFDAFADNRSMRTRQANLRYLAEETDGVAVVNTNNIEPALARIVDDLSSYYLLGYYSTNTELDGRFRNIKVRVTRPGVDVRHRRGYRARTAEELVSTATGTPAEDADAALTSAFNSVAGSAARTAFRIRASSWVDPASGGEPQGRFWVVGELDYRTRRELEWTAGAQASVTVVAADGTTVMSRDMDVPAGDGPFVVGVPDTGRLPVGEYAVRVRLRATADDALALSDTARVRMEAGSTLGEAVFWRSGPSTGRQYQRTADPQFMRNERMRLELPTTAGSPASARLLDRNGNPLAVPAETSQRPDPGAGLTWIVVDLTLSPLAPADYAVEVVQGDERRVTGFRLVR
jgi:VWFA-related protein